MYKVSTALAFKVKSKVDDFIELGSIKINIANSKSVFNAIASNLNFMIENPAGDISFIVERNGEQIFEREYSVNYLIDNKKQQVQKFIKF